MSEYTTNAEANVSAAKGVVGGYCWRAPIGTALPETPSWTPTSAWDCMGYVTEDGETFSTSSNVTEFRDQNGDVMDTSQSQYGETFACSFAETKEHTFESIYGADAVTDTNGVLKVNHTGEEPEAYSYAFLFLLKNGRKWVRFAEKAKRTTIGDLTTNSANVLAWNATYQVLRSETTGGYFVDLFESTETGSTSGSAESN
ncbi:MAG: hypothetical protein IJI16_04125 [Atopobiaceae bacterium]|nr:hypothetical protein [Atopobiaceae bacterium]